MFSNNVLVQRMSEGYTVTRMLPVLLLSLYYNIPVYHMAKFLFLFFQASIYSTFLFHLPLAPGDSPLFIYITDCSFLFFLHVERVLKTSRKHVMKPHCLFSPTYNFFHSRNEGCATGLSFYSVSHFSSFFQPRNLLYGCDLPSCSILQVPRS